MPPALLGLGVVVGLVLWVLAREYDGQDSIEAQARKDARVRRKRRRDSVREDRTTATQENLSIRETLMALHDDLRAAIDKNLSAETAGVLRARLDSIDGLEKRVAELTKAKETADSNEQRRVEAGTKLAAENASLSAKVLAFEAREAILAGAERNILIANMQREKADAVVDAIRGVVSQVFQNATLKRSILTNAQEPVYTPPSAANNYGSVQTATRTESKTITEEG